MLNTKSSQRSLDSSPIFSKYIVAEIGVENQNISLYISARLFRELTLEFCDWLDHVIGLMWQATIGENYVELSRHCREDS